MVTMVCIFYAERHYSECHYAERHGAIYNTISIESYFKTVLALTSISVYYLYRCLCLTLYHGATTFKQNGTQPRVIQNIWTKKFT